MLRIENEALRTNIARLSNRLDKQELAASPTSSPSKNHPNDPDAMQELQSMMISIQMAKEEALKHGSNDSSREKLISDIHYLHSLLVKAREERKLMSGKIESLKTTVKLQKESYDKLQARRTHDKVIFVEMLKRERQNFEEKLVENDRKVLWFEQEMRKVGTWARDRQKDYNGAAGNLAKSIVDAKEETVVQANEYNLDLAAELESLRYEANELLSK
ncbi:hypothetical protein TL16_g08542 [Triparma laevis f. inornata]|uniref:Uncharacterized protein n=1 Tax=Triparma laevis f. inornata TaxID=1714386 RepID=A0A9W7AYQ0_9STRA|nr:hypothetical protein TL16_g08542 [Triparma laevis f. inornata]